METRSGSVRIVLAGLLLVACKSGGGAPDPKMGESGAGGAVERGEFVAQGMGQGIDVASIRYAPGAVVVEFEASPWGLMAALALDPCPKADGLSVTYLGAGERLDHVLDESGLLLVRPPRDGSGSRHRIAVEFEASEGPRVRVAPTDPTDRGRVEFVLGGDEDPMADRRVFSGVVLRDFLVDDASAVPRAEPAAEALEGLIGFCERELLTRAPFHASDELGGPAAAWFGGLVAAVKAQRDIQENAFGYGFSPPTDEPGHAVSALASVLEALHGETLPAAERTPMRLGDDAWAVPRYMALRKMIGAAAFREVLREIVDRHRGGDPISYTEVAAAFRDMAGDDAGHFVETWLAGPARPVIRTQWRFDGERSRLLLRLHQVHDAAGNVPAAFPLSVPLRVIFADGSMQDHTVEITARRELVEVACDGEPLAVTFDPDDRLVGLCSLEVDE